MIRFAYRKGLRFLEGGKIWTVIKRLITGKIQLEDEQGEIQNLEWSELNTRWLGRLWVIDEASLGPSSSVFYHATPRDLGTFDQRNQELARRRHAYLVRLEQREGGFVSTPAKLKPILDEIAKELGHEKAPPPSTVYRWWRKWKATKCATKLVDGRLKSGRSRNSELYGFFEEALYEVYLTLQKNGGKAVLDSMKVKVKRANADLPEDKKIPLPKTATIYRWLKKLQADIVHRARLGKDSSEKEFRAALKTLQVKRILERVEIDHTPLDLIIFDKWTRLPLGRPWLTLAIDVFSRMILGFYISFHPPSSFSVLQCIKRAILPKDAWLSRFPDIKEKWPAQGIPELIAADNGMDLHSDAFEDICNEIGTEILYCPAGNPELKGAIERMFRTLNTGLFHRLPGTVFSNVDERGDYPSEELAALDMETLVHVLTKWIVEVYHRTKHSGIGMPPLAKWNEGLSERAIELPAYPEELEVLVGIPMKRTLFHYGLEYDCLRYNSPQLQLLRARTGDTPQVSFKCYEHDVGYIHAFDEVQKEYLRVPAVRSEYANGLSRHMHRLIRIAAEKKYGAMWSDDQLLESKMEIQAIVAAAVSDKKMNNRKKAAQVQVVDSEQVLSGETAFAQAQKPTVQKDVKSDQLPSGLDDELPEFGTSTKTENIGENHECRV